MKVVRHSIFLALCDKREGAIPRLFSCYHKCEFDYFSDVNLEQGKVTNNGDEKA